MFFLKKWKLENDLINEMKQYAFVKDFPFEDAKRISQILTAYDRGNAFINLSLMGNSSIFEKYPILEKNWDSLMIKYKKKGLFPNWKILLVDEEEPEINKSFTNSFRQDKSERNIYKALFIITFIALIAVSYLAIHNYTVAKHNADMYYEIVDQYQ